MADTLEQDTLALLQRIEWSQREHPWKYLVVPACPICGGYRHDVPEDFPNNVGRRAGHHARCELDELIRKAAKATTAKARRKRLAKPKPAKKRRANP